MARVSGAGGRGSVRGVLGHQGGHDAADQKVPLGKQGMAKFANGLKGNAHGGRQGRV